MAQPRVPSAGFRNLCRISVLTGDNALIACGLGAGLFAFFPLEVELSWVLMGLTVLLMVDFGLHYLFNKRRG